MMKSVFVSLAVLTLSAFAARAAVQSDIEYGTADGVSLRLDARTPEGNGSFPVVIIVHGGGWSGGDKQKDITPLFEPLTKADLTWFTINYRLAPTNRWPACYEDVKTAIRWVKQHAPEYKGDPQRIAIAGHSAGGQLACLAAVLAESDTRVQAVIGFAAVTDFEEDTARRGGLSKSLQDLLNRPKEPDDETRKILRDLSPINHIKPGLPPFLLIHGDADKTVPLQQSLNLQAKLKENGVACDLITIKGAPHAVLAWEKIDTSYKDGMIEWLKKVLGGVP